VSLTLALSTASMGVFSTYILIDNLDNPFDRKTVRVTMEVCPLSITNPNDKMHCELYLTQCMY
jgi:hypothetical protein